MFEQELFVDLFAGGGGASEGIEQAIERPVDVAVNHDPVALALHQVNHPKTLHYVTDVFDVEPVTACGGYPVGGLWASFDCKHFSKAKGGKPVDKKIRSLAWVVVKWAKIKRPRVIFAENVEEFQTWGPLLKNNMPCPRRRGATYRRWIKELESLGYAIEWRELRGCDYGAPTIRKRWFMVARCDGQSIVWPKPTHGAPDSLPVKAGKLLPWRTAAECIDWSIPCPSIFERTRPLAEATLRRIAKGIMRYVVDADEPFIVPGAVAPFLTEHANASTQRNFAAGDPLRTQCAEVKGGHFALVSAFLAKHYGGVVGIPLDVPTGTVTTQDHHSLVTAQLVGVGGRAGQSRPRSVDEPTATFTAKADTAIVTSNLIKLRGTSKGAQTLTEPLHTVSAQGLHHAEVRAFLIKYYGADQDPRLGEPLHTVTTRDRFGLVMVHGEPYQIVDIGMRMLTPRELYLAQGFPPSYIIDRDATGKPLSKKDQVRMCGNSVCPPLARAIVGANYHDAQTRMAAAA
ncbi:MAG TPA: DNA cytosine methyltransferase [Ramlibacter sp.]|nr:DNA cytosine methyltransferase [Ramlibacter sp.]